MQNYSDLDVEKHCGVFTIVHCLRASIYKTSPSLINPRDNGQMCCWISFPACLLRKKPSWHILHKPRSKAIIIKDQKNTCDTPTHAFVHGQTRMAHWLPGLRLPHLHCALHDQAPYVRLFVNKQQHKIDTCICIFQPLVSLISNNNPYNLLIINCVLKSWYATYTKENLWQLKNAHYR